MGMNLVLKKMKLTENQIKNGYEYINDDIDCIKNWLSSKDPAKIDNIKTKVNGLMESLQELQMHYKKIEAMDETLKLLKKED